MSISRRGFFQLAGTGTGLLLQAQWLKGQQAPIPEVELQEDRTHVAMGQPLDIQAPPAKVALIHGGNRRKNIYEALMTIDGQIQAGLRRKKYVVIKPNLVSVANQLAATHVDAIAGVLDYLAPRFRGPVVIAEASARADTFDGYKTFGYTDLARERKAQQVSLVDLNREGKYVTLSLLDYDLHSDPVRLAARLADPDAYVICCSMLKTHSSVVATMTVKNMVMGAPLHSPPGEPQWNDKRRYHAGVRQHNFNMYLTAERLHSNWGIAVIDGFEGMEGNGPHNGTPVPSHLAIASTDFIAADRVGLAVMGIDPGWLGYLVFSGRAGIGQYDLSKIDVEGAAIASVERKYRLPDAISRELQWMGPMNTLPPKPGLKADLSDPFHDLQEYLQG
jgi:uncharacterized protein (DUF362 family)